MYRKLGSLELREHVIVAPATQEAESVLFLGVQSQLVQHSKTVSPQKRGCWG